MDRCQKYICFRVRRISQTSWRRSPGPSPRYELLLGNQGSFELFLYKKNLVMLGLELTHMLRSGWSTHQGRRIPCSWAWYAWVRVQLGGKIVRSWAWYVWVRVPEWSLLFLGWKRLKGYWFPSIVRGEGIAPKINVTKSARFNELKNISCAKLKRSTRWLL